ncbi:MAG: CBS domain-containing protein, partial [Candidatus Acidiferrales bacterium]
ILHNEDTFAEALKKTSGLPEQHFLVNQGSRGWSAVTREMLQWQTDEGKGDESLASLPADARLPWLHPDQTLDVALRMIGDRPLLPVVNRADPGKIEGVITLQDILNSYRKKLAASGRPAPG